jgi:hypothetical protein
VATVPAERTGVLVIRAWIEGDPPSLRLRITQTDDIVSRREETRVAASIDEAVDIARSWLEQFAAR